MNPLDFILDLIGAALVFALPLAILIL